MPSPASTVVPLLSSTDSLKLTSELDSSVTVLSISCSIGSLAVGVVNGGELTRLLDAAARQRLALALHDLATAWIVDRPGELDRDPARGPVVVSPIDVEVRADLVGVGVLGQA